MRKCLFIDIDGVLHPSTAILSCDVATVALRGGNALKDAGLCCFSQKLEDVLAESPCDIGVVVHSSWRTKYWADSRLLRDVLGPLAHRFEGTTPPHMPRHQSILYVCQRAEIDDYLILDDAQDEFPPSASGLVVTNPLLGVSDPDALEAVRAWAQLVPRTTRLLPRDEQGADAMVGARQSGGSASRGALG